MGRVVKPPVMPIHLPRKDWTRLISVAADSDNRLNWLLQKIVYVLRAMSGDINANFLHDLNRERMDVAGRIRPGALHIQNISGSGAQYPFGQMAPAGIPRAEDQNGRFHRHWRLQSSAGSSLRMPLSFFWSSVTRGLASRDFSIQSSA